MASTRVCGTLSGSSNLLAHPGITKSIMNFDAKISPVIAFVVLITITVSAIVVMESFSIVVEREMDQIVKTM